MQRTKLGWDFHERGGLPNCTFVCARQTTRAAARRCTASRARRRRQARARSEWRRMGARSEHEALGVFMRDVHRRSPPARSLAGAACVLWRSWARVIRGRLPVIGLPNADFLHHGPSPAYSRGRGAVGGAEPWPQVHTPGVGRSYAGGGARGGGIGGGPVSGARRPRAGRYRLSRPCPG